MMLARKTIAVAVALTLPAATLFGNDAAAADDVATTLPEVTVRAARQPIGASHVNDAHLAHMRAATSDTASLLGNEPGVSLYGAGGVSSLPTMHGLADDRLRIKVDGMDLIAACPNHMNSPLSYIDPTNVGAIQVFSGIAPVSMGGDSIGGSILVSSPSPEFAAPGQGALLKGHAGAFYRSNGQAMGGNLSATVANEKLSLTYTGSTAESDNYKAGGDFKTTTATGRPGHTLPLDEVGSSAYKSTNQSLDLALKNDNHLFDLKFTHQHIPYENYPNQRMDMTRNDSDQVNLSYAGQYHWGELKARVYHEETRHKMDFADDKQYVYGAPPGVVAPGMPMDTEGKNTGAQLKADIRLSERDLLRMGGEYQRYRLNDWWPPSPADLTGMLDSSGRQATMGGMAPNTFWNINNGQRDRYALFGEWQARVSPVWTSLLGVRHETVKMDTGAIQGYNNSMMYGDPANPASIPGSFNAANRQRTDHNWDLTALARYSADASRSVEFGYAMKTRSPNLYERYAWSTNAMAMEMVNFAGDGNGYVGNRDLKPEVAHTVGATAEWRDAAEERWGLKVSPYYTYVEDYIDAQRCSPANPTCPKTQPPQPSFVYLQFVNQSARLYGIDLSANYLLAKTSGYGSYTATGLINYVKGENQTSGGGLYNIMPLNAKLALVHRLGGWTSTAEGVFVEAKNDVSDVRNEIKTSGYGLLNLRSSYEWKKVRFDVGVDNVFDRLYAYPLGGAYVGQGATMSFNREVGTIGTSGGSASLWGTPVPGMGRSIYAGVNVKF